WGVRTRNKIPLCAIPVFRQSELGTALERDDILARGPNVVTRQRDDTDQDLIGSVGIEIWGRDDAPACTIPMDGQCFVTARVPDRPHIVGCNSGYAKQNIILRTVVRTWHNAPGRAIPVQRQRARFLLGSAHGPDIV